MYEPYVQKLYMKVTGTEKTFLSFPIQARKGERLKLYYGFGSVTV